MPLVSYFPVAGGGNMKQASGTFDGGTRTVTVSGVGFRPKLVLGRVINSGSWTYGAVFYAFEGNAYAADSGRPVVLSFSFTDDGFVLNNVDFHENGQFTWTAYTW